MKVKKDTTEFEMNLGKCFAYINMNPASKLPNDYRATYETLTNAIEEMDCGENIRAVMRLRYRYGYKFGDIAQILGVSYQWVYELHKNGVRLLEKHLSF